LFEGQTSKPRRRTPPGPAHVRSRNEYAGAGATAVAAAASASCFCADAVAQALARVAPRRPGATLAVARQHNPDVDVVEGDRADLHDVLLAFVRELRQARHLVWSSGLECDLVRQARTPGRGGFMILGLVTACGPVLRRAACTRQSVAACSTATGSNDNEFRSATANRLLRM
jgi:hypothetical protein